MEWKGPLKYAVFIAGMLLLSALAVRPLLIRDREIPRYHMEGAYFDVGGKGAWITSRVGEERFQIMKDGIWTDIIIKGVNMGAAKPGYFPGEAAITYSEYRDWFRLIGEMNANAVRIYTHHPPDFYRALLEYNRVRPDPIFLFQGVTLDEIAIHERCDAFDDEVSTVFIDNIAMAVDIIHGNRKVEPTVGIADGIYRHDVSEYVLGYILGIEYDPYIVNGTNSNNRGIHQLDGRFFRTVEASPMEIWLARMMDFCAGYEYDNYDCQRAQSFINWPTTDPLEHKYEPRLYDDWETIDDRHFRVKSHFYPGFFASYHVYPNYPDFLNLDPSYANYISKYGRASPYASYLNDLKKTLSIPILVAEYGISSSRGIAHFNNNGMHHGGLTEKEQGAYTSSLFNDIIDEGYAGGLLFSWQDEWFKRAWNTMDYMNPGRRPYWNDVQTCEQCYGMLAFDPVSEHRIVIDGSSGDWERVDPLGRTAGSRYNIFDDGYDDGRDLQAVQVHHDAAYLYLRLEYMDLQGPPDWSRMRTMVLLDTVQDQGVHVMPFGSGIVSERGIDFLIQLNGEESRVIVDSYYDVNHYDYAVDEGVIPIVEYANRKDNGIFHTIELTHERGYIIERFNISANFSTHETGKLRWGVADPAMPNYNSLADISWGDDSLEMRIPWLLLNFRDPSRKEVMGDMWRDGLKASQRIDGIHLAVITYKPDAFGNFSHGTNHPPISDSIPRPLSGVFRRVDFMFYGWDNWDIPEYVPRLKASYHIMQQCYGSYP
ncbi:MAG: hypothetical protein QCI82_01720 [Candidatus Thermoplasmatota archaeon]|nr:hypothetical protein [Candidatus Thermoplasmatota archaeon]